MTEPRARVERTALAGMLAAAVLGSGVPGAWALVGLTAAVWLVADRFAAAGTVLAMRALRMVGDVMVVATGVIAFIWTLYPVISEDTLRRIGVPLALALASIALVGLAASRDFPPGRTLLPTTFSLLVLDALFAAPGPRFPLCVAGAGLVGCLFLLCERPALDRRAVAPRLASLAGFLAGVAVLGAGIARFLPWAQPMVEAATVSMIAENAGSGYAGFSGTSRLGDIEELALSRRVVLRAFTDTPQRLRGRVFTRFDGRAWAAEPPREKAELVAANPAALPAPLPRFFEDVPGSVLAVPGLGPLPDSGLVRTRIVQTMTGIPTLLAPMAPLLVGLASKGASLDELGIVTPSPLGAVEIYAIANLYGGPAPGQPAPELTLQLPPSPDPRMLALAETLGGKSGSAEEKLRRTLYHLERCCRYSLKVPRPTSKDPIAGFLFETRRGYCEYFASAAALLLRLQGVPTRYVTGFNVRDESLVGRHYAVRESDAHAWVESYVPGSGWLEFDPTPSAQFAEVHKDSQPGAMTALLERLLALTSEVWARLRAGSLLSSARWALRRSEPALLAMAVIGGLLLVRRLLSRRAESASPRRPDEQEFDPRVRELLVRVDALLRRRGHPRPVARAPLEHLESLKEGALPAQEKTDAARAVECFYRARYGSAHPPADEVLGLLHRLPTA